MASSTKNKSLCKTCNKAQSVFFCEGCQKGFCKNHANEHRQELSKQLETIVVEHDQLKQNLAEYTQQPSCYPLMKEIDHWEIQSIDKIRKVADDARKQLPTIIDSHRNKITEELQHLTQELRTARSEDNFIETDLEEWMKKLEEYTKELATPSTINIQQEEAEPPFIQKIVVSTKKNDFFEQSAGNIQIEDDGQIVVLELGGHSTTRCHADYSSGQHKFRFKIEQMHSPSWIYFGIVSKNTPLQVRSYSTPTTFGWTTNGYVYLNGSGQLGYNGYKSDVIKDDIIELFLDCDRRKILLTDKRTNKKHQLDVDVNACPFPWQLHIGLCYQNDRIRYLSA